MNRPKHGFCFRLPDLAEHIILEYLDYRLRNGKYIRRLPKDLPVYELLSERPCAIECVFKKDDVPNLGEYYDENGNVYYYDDDGYNCFYRIILVKSVSFQKRDFPVEETIDLSFSYGDRNKFQIEACRYYQLHCDYKVRSVKVSL